MRTCTRREVEVVVVVRSERMVLSFVLCAFPSNTLLLFLSFETPRRCEHQNATFHVGTKSDLTVRGWKRPLPP